MPTPGDGLAPRARSRFSNYELDLVPTITQSGEHVTPPEARVDERADLSRKLAFVAAMRIALITTSLGSSFLFLDLEAEFSTWEYTLIGAAYLVSLIYTLALRANRSVVVLAHAQVIVDCLLVTWLVLMTGGSDSVFSFVYVFVVIGAAMTLYRRGAVIATLLSLLLFGTLVLLQLENLLEFLPKLDASRAALSFFMYSIGLGLLGFLASTLAETARSRGRALAAKESEYERLEELQGAILRSLPAGLMTVDQEGAVQFVNESALAILRYAPRDVLEHPIAEVCPSIAELWDQFVKVGRAPNPRERYEGNFTRIDGSNIRLGFSFAPMSPRPDEFGLIIVFQDVTDIVNLQEAVERAERLASIGKIAAGLAHEVRNPLSSMCASIDVIKGAIDPPDALRRLMDNVVSEADRLNVLINDFLDFARPRKLDLAKADVSQIVSGVIEVLRHEATFEGVELSVTLEPGLDAVVDKDSMRQVIWNLLRNAGEAMTGDERRLSVVTRSTPEFVDILVRDSGPGIGAEDQKRIFDPFFTTKSGGTGLGLAIVHSVVEAHAGTVLVSSEAGEGTQFMLRLPRSDSMMQYELSFEETDPSLNVTPSSLEVLGGPL